MLILRFKSSWGLHFINNNLLNPGKDLNSLSVELNKIGIKNKVVFRRRDQHYNCNKELYWVETYEMIFAPYDKQGCGSDWEFGARADDVFKKHRENPALVKLLKEYVTPDQDFLEILEVKHNYKYKLIVDKDWRNHEQEQVYLSDSPIKLIDISYR